MPFSDEVRGPLPAFRLTVHSRLQITSLADQLEAKWGAPGIGMGLRGEEHAVEVAAARLTTAGGRLAALDHKHRKAALMLLWQPREDWGARFVERWLAWAGAEWSRPAALKRIWRCYLLRFDEQAEATRLMAAWLVARSEGLPEAIRAFSAKWQLFETLSAAAKAAGSVLADRGFIADVEQIAGRGAIQGSALMASILESAGKTLRIREPTVSPAERVAELLGDTDGAMGRIDAPPPLMRRARGALAYGLVSWAAASNCADAERETYELLVSMMDDPRLHRASWDGVDDQTIGRVEAWLSRKTLDTFFQIIDHLNTDQPHHWPARKAFWERYLPEVRRAWLLCGRTARPLAQKLGVQCGVLEGGSSDHCSLMLQIGGIVVVETNHNASALFFGVGNQNSPKFYSTGFYARPSLIASCDEKLTHQGSWQWKFQRWIAGHAFGAARFRA